MAQRSGFEIIKNTRGFTIVEMVIACAICLVLMVAASTHFISVAKSLENADRFTSQAIQQQSGSYFKEVFVRASPTYHFLKLPIAVNCASYKLPCLRKFDSNSRRFVPNESVASDSDLNSFISSRLTPAAGVQFYRDGTGSLATKKSSNIAVPPTTPGSPVINSPLVQIPVPIDTTVSASSHTDAVYATWPLRDETSQPFPVMVQKPNYVMFTHVPTLATSKTVSHSMAFFTARGQRALFPALENSLAAIYTLNDPSEYAVGFMKHITDCVDPSNTSRCLAWAKEINNGIDATYVSKKTGATSTAFNDLLNNGLVAIELYDPFKAPGTDIVSQIQTSFPDLAVFNNSISSVRWQSTVSSNFYEFPGDSWSLYDGASSTANVDLASPFDIRRVQHYYTNLQSQVQIVLLPVDLETFWLEKKSSDEHQLNLVSQFVRDSSNTAGSQKRILIDDVIPNPNNLPPNTVPQVLYFSRKLGTPTVDVVIEHAGASK